ncbi:hypothetical protein CYMTET_52677 [Cymbomonas tetramitiformis]|uniref:Uncharacterized protein n=1 Tax=Cymbomonas tetramitiformis TaxID=36881 RepID=A0AAE0BK99_9CHLO|nr:hypothetical protein CYMTET_52677 [Cymbomonas tetramitiformis]
MFFSVTPLRIADGFLRVPNLRFQLDQLAQGSKLIGLRQLQNSLANSGTQVDNQVVILAVKELIDIMASGPSSWVSFLQGSRDPHPRAKTHKTLIKRHKDFEKLWRHLTEMTLMNCSERQVKEVILKAQFTFECLGSGQRLPTNPAKGAAASIRLLQSEWEQVKGKVAQLVRRDCPDALTSAVKDYYRLASSVKDFQVQAGKSGQSCSVKFISDLGQFLLTLEETSELPASSRAHISQLRNWLRGAELGLEDYALDVLREPMQLPAHSPDPPSSSRGVTNEDSQADADTDDEMESFWARDVAVQTSLYDSLSEEGGEDEEESMAPTSEGQQGEARPSRALPAAHSVPRQAGERGRRGSLEHLGADENGGGDAGPRGSRGAPDSAPASPGRASGRRRYPTSAAPPATSLVSPSGPGGLGMQSVVEEPRKSPGKKRRRVDPNTSAEPRDTQATGRGRGSGRGRSRGGIRGDGRGGRREALVEGDVDEGTLAAVPNIWGGSSLKAAARRAQGQATSLPVSQADVSGDLQHAKVRGKRSRRMGRPVDGAEATGSAEGVEHAGDGNLWGHTMMDVVAGPADLNRHSKGGEGCAQGQRGELAGAERLRPAAEADGSGDDSNRAACATPSVFPGTEESRDGSKGAGGGDAHSRQARGRGRGRSRGLQRGGMAGGNKRSCAKDEPPVVASQKMRRLVLVEDPVTLGPSMRSDPTTADPSTADRTMPDRAMPDRAMPDRTMPDRTGCSEGEVACIPDAARPGPAEAVSMKEAARERQWRNTEPPANAPLVEGGESAAPVREDPVPISREHWLVDDFAPVTRSRLQVAVPSMPELPEREEAIRESPKPPFLAAVDTHPAPSNRGGRGGRRGRPPGLRGRGRGRQPQHMDGRRASLNASVAGEGRSVEGTSVGEDGPSLAQGRGGRVSPSPKRRGRPPLNRPRGLVPGRKAPARMLGNPGVGASVNVLESPGAGAREPDEVLGSPVAGVPAEVPVEVLGSLGAGLAVEVPGCPGTGVPAEVLGTPGARAPAEMPSSSGMGAPTELPASLGAGAPAEAPASPGAVAPAEAPASPGAGAPAEAPASPGAVAPAEAPASPGAVVPAEAPCSAWQALAPRRYMHQLLLLVRAPGREAVESPEPVAEQPSRVASDAFAEAGDGDTVQDARQNGGDAGRDRSRRDAAPAGSGEETGEEEVTVELEDPEEIDEDTADYIRLRRRLLMPRLDEVGTRTSRTRSGRSRTSMRQASYPPAIRMLPSGAQLADRLADLHDQGTTASRALALNILRSIEQYLGQTHQAMLPVKLQYEAGLVDGGDVDLITGEEIYVDLAQGEASETIDLQDPEFDRLENELDTLCMPTVRVKVEG